MINKFFCNLSFARQYIIKYRCIWGKATNLSHSILSHIDTILQTMELSYKSMYDS